MVRKYVNWKPFAWNLKAAQDKVEVSLFVNVSAHAEIWGG